MSVTSPSIPHIRISPSSSSFSSSSPSFRVLFTTKSSALFTIRSSQADGPIRRPVAPPTLKPTVAPPQQTPVPSAVAPPQQMQKPSAIGEGKSVITLEFQRQKAKELQEYFKLKKVQEADQGPFFGFVAKNEISNGRWAMFGFAVGMLTEYATGSDFVDQVKILLSNFGIVDLE